MNTQFGAWIAAAITALQITLNSVGMPAQQISNFLSDPFNVAYTYQDSQLDQYFDQSNIQILPGNTVIDGVVYDDIWLSESAAEIFRVNAFDWQSAYSIASNTNGTFASGTGTLGNYPIFTVNNVKRTQTLNEVLGDTPTINNTEDGTFGIIRSPSGVPNKYRVDSYLHFNNQFNSYSLASNVDLNDYNWNCYLSLDIYSDSVRVTIYNYRENSLITSNYRNYPDTIYDASPFDFDYVSGNIPSDTPLSSDDGLLMHIPHHSGTSHLEQFLIDNPEFSEPGGVVVDPTIDPDINTKLDDLINIIAPLIPVIQASFDVAPTPVPPTPGETIADTDYSVLDTILQSIHNAIQSIPQEISSLGDRILQDIEEGPIRVFDKVLDIFRTIFSPVIALITSGLSIWTYVISWLNTITAPFTFILSVLPSGVMIPIYAAIAGFLCISIFRRFGK